MYPFMYQLMYALMYSFMYPFIPLCHVFEEITLSSEPSMVLR